MTSAAGTEPTDHLGAVVITSPEKVAIGTSPWGHFNAQSITTLVVVLGAGPVIYLIARDLRRRRNQIDLNMAMRELPPE